nr:hypothetical protein [Klebsiella pneumoniae]
MVSKNSEAPLAATFGASIENNREGNIDMNSDLAPPFPDSFCILS